MLFLMRKVNIKMSIIPKLTHTINTIQVSTGIFLELNRVIYGENLLH